MNLPMPLHGGAIRPGFATTGSFDASSSARRLRLAGRIVSAVMSGSTPERSRTAPCASTSAGFSAPLAPYRISFMVILQSVGKRHCRAERSDGSRHIDQPPSMTCAVPVVKPDSSLAR